MFLYTILQILKFWNCISFWDFYWLIILSKSWDQQWLLCIFSLLYYIFVDNCLFLQFTLINNLNYNKYCYLFVKRRMRLFFRKLIFIILWKHMKTFQIFSVGRKGCKNLPYQLLFFNTHIEKIRKLKLLILSSFVKDEFWLILSKFN